MLLPFGPDTVRRAPPRRTHPKLVGMIPKPERRVNEGFWGPGMDHNRLFNQPIGVIEIPVNSS